MFPDTIAVGRRTTVLVVGLGTAFDGTTTFSAGTNVTVHSVLALNGGALRVELTAAAAATLGARDVIATTGTQVLTLTNGLSISPGARGTVVAGTLAQGGAATVRVEVTSGKQFNAVVSGSTLTALNTTVTGTGFTPVGMRWLNSTTIEATFVISPTANTMTSPTLTVTFEDASTEVITLGNIAATAPIALPTTATAGTLGTIRGAVYSYTATTAPLRLNIATVTTGTTSWTAGTRVYDSTGTVLNTGAGTTSAFIPSNGSYFVTVNDSVGGSPNATFTIAGTESVVAANSVCAAPTALTLGTPLTGEVIATGGSAPTACLNTATGPARYYSFTLAAGEGATVRVTPTVAFNANLRVVDSCSATVCAAFADDVTFSSITSEVLAVRNTGTADRLFVVAVGSAAGTASGTYTLTATRQLYRVTTPAAACQDMTGATVLSSTLTDDSATPNTALPFGFTYSSTPVVSFSASSNGLLQLFTAASGTAPTSGANVAWPASSSNNLLAPFWDDFANYAPTARVETLTVGTAPNQTFVVQWFSPTFFSSTGNERLTFQVKFFEGSNVIEFHYCSLVPNTGSATRVLGDSATIGISSPTSSDTGIGLSFNRPNAVSTTTAFRFTPVPVVPPAL